VSCDRIRRRVRVRFKLVRGRVRVWQWVKVRVRVWIWARVKVGIWGG